MKILNIKDIYLALFMSWRLDRGLSERQNVMNPTLVYTHTCLFEPRANSPIDRNDIFTISPKDLEQARIPRGRWIETNPSE